MYAQELPNAVARLRTLINLRCPVLGIRVLAIVGARSTKKDGIESTIGDSLNQVDCLVGDMMICSYCGA